MREGVEWRCEVWRDQPQDNHTWAFFYYCKRQGDRVRILRRSKKSVDIEICQRVPQPTLL